MSDFGTLFAQLRKKAGYTQLSLAEVLNITDKAVSKWERGLCLPDISLLPQLSILLDVDMECLVANSLSQSDWIGVLDLPFDWLDLSEILYDKPMVSYFLSNFSLAGIHSLYFNVSARNRAYIDSIDLCRLGFSCRFTPETLPVSNFVLLDRPSFVFGSDLTRHFNVAMASDSLVKFVTSYNKESYIFCPAVQFVMNNEKFEGLRERAKPKNLGRAMISIDLDSKERIEDVAELIRIYQHNTGLIIGAAAGSF